MIFVQLDNNVVTGILESARMPDVLPPGRTFVQTTEKEIPVFGSTYNPVDSTFAPPPPPVTIQPVTNAEILAELKKLTVP